MKCERCSAEMPTQSQFCLRCGAPVRATAANPTGAMAPPSFAAPPPRANRWMLPTVVALSLLVVGLGALVVRGSLLQKPTNTTSGKLVQSPSEGGSGSLVQAPAQGNGGNLVQAPTEQEPTKMVQAPGETVPQEVLDYLAFLKSIEVTKQALGKEEFSKASAQLATLPAKQLQDVMAQMNGGDVTPESQPKNGPSKEAVEQINSDIADKWDQLAQKLRQHPVPDSCQDLHNKYLSHLGMTESEVIKLHSIMTTVGQSPSDAQSALTELYQMLNSTKSQTNASSSASDSALAAVCDRWHIAKDFDIKDVEGDAPGLGGLFR